jgi:hypothetical protein
LRDERTIAFVTHFIGNGSITTTDMEEIIPIFL